MYRTMLDLIKPKLVYLDLPLFMALLSDLFPGVELPTAEGGELRAALEVDLKAHGLQIMPEFLAKIIQVRSCPPPGIRAAPLLAVCTGLEAVLPVHQLQSHHSAHTATVQHASELLCRSSTAKLRGMAI